MMHVCTECFEDMDNHDPCPVCGQQFLAPCCPECECNSWQDHLDGDALTEESLREHEEWAAWEAVEL